MIRSFDSDKMLNANLHLRWLTTVFSGERVPCFNLAKNAKRGFLLDCLSL